MRSNHHEQIIELSSNVKYLFYCLETVLLF